MGFDNARVILDSPSNSYYAGQTMNGRLTFSRDKVKKFRGIYVQIRGYCKVHWTSQERNMHSRGDHDRYHTVNHDSYEDYFDQKIYLAGSSSGDHELPPGHHDFPFSIRIPDNCPSAIEGEYGHVRYEMRVVVDRAFKMDQEMTVPIKILSPLDLNMVPNAREPIQMKMEDSYCCWCMNAGSSETIIKLPASGFCPGQVIPVELSCINRSSEEIDLKVAIKKELTFRAQHVAGTKHERSTLLEEKRGPVPPHVTKNWTVELIVPQMEVFNLRSCTFINVEYELKVTVSPDGCHDDSDDSCYLIFGSIPLGATQPIDSPQAIPPTQAFPQAVITQPLSNAPYPGYPNGQNQPYPGQNPPYPGQNPPYPGQNPPYSGQNPPYPGQSLPYPGQNPPYPGQNPPYPGQNPPYPGQNEPYPSGIPPTAYPSNTPYPAPTSPFPPNPYPPSPQSAGFQTSPNPMSTPYPNPTSPYPPALNENNPLPGPPQGSENPPYPITPPGSNPPYSSPGRTSPYPNNPYPAGPVSTSLKTGTFGFTHGDDKGASVPLLPDGAAVPMPKPTSPNPYAASAPVPTTPDDASKPLMPPGGLDDSQPPPYNPAFANQNTH